jgi:predicted alpha/beta hydrolase
VHGEVVPFRAGDGMPLKLGHFRGEAEPTRGPVLLVAGTGVRGAIFSSAPQPRTMVDALVNEGYDVWVEDWRASIDFPPLRYTLDQAAVFDHPAAVREIRERTGAESIKALVHCQGSTSFTMSSLAGLVDDVRTVVSNAVSLHPVVPKRSRAKLSLLTPVASRIYDGADPQWAVRPPTPTRKALAKWVQLTRHDCDEPACVMSQYIYGAGSDVLWRHANLDTATHHWVAREFGYVPFSFFRQILASVKAGHLVPADDLPALPRSFVDATPPQEQLWTFVGGERNVCFMPEGQERSRAWFREHSPQDHGFVEFPGYSHLDVFFGRDASQDTFPHILAGLEREPVPSG